MSIALIVPTYSHFNYALKTVNSFLEHTPGDDNKVYVVDDASPDWGTVNWDEWPAHVMAPYDMPRETLLTATHKELDPTANGDERIIVYHHTRHHGLTRSWNMGLRLGKKSKPWAADIVICGNSDILFTPGWHEPLVEGLSKFDLVGPLTNAAGRVFDQNVKRFHQEYKLTDDPAYLATLADTLKQKYQNLCKKTGRINGFFMAAYAKTWWSVAYDKDHVFDPHDRMDNAAYELQERWRYAGRTIALVPSSFIFHYRSISRGRRGLVGECGRGAWRPDRKTR